MSIPPGVLDMWETWQAVSCVPTSSAAEDTARSHREDKIGSAVCPQGLVTLSHSLRASERKPAHRLAFISLSVSWGDDY